MTEGNAGVHSEQSRKKPEYTTDSIAQEHIEDQSVATIDKKEMCGKHDCTVMKSGDGCESIKSNEKKLKIVIKKNLETGEWSAGEELKLEAKKCAGDSLLDCHSRENKNCKPIMRSAVKRKATYSAGMKRKNDCKKVVQNNEIALGKIKVEVDMVRKKSCSKVLYGKNSKSPEKTVCLLSANYCADNFEKDDACHLDAPQNVKINQVTLTNETCAKHNEYQYDSKDVYVVELYGEGDSVLSKDKDLKSEVTENIDESVHIKLLPLSTAECKKDLSTETEINLQRSVNEKEEVNFIDETEIENYTKEKEANIKSRSMKNRVVEKVSGVNGTDINQTSEKENRKISKHVKEMKSNLNGLTEEKNPDVDILDYTDKERFTDFNERTSQKYTEVAETLPCLKELSLETDADMKETVIEMNTDVNDAFVRKDDYVNGIAREQKSNSVEETNEQDTDLNQAAVNNVNINEKTSEKDLNISDTKLDPLLQLENLNRSPGNIKDMDELLNWTVAQTLYHNDKKTAETPGTSQTCNMQYSNVADNYLENKSSELTDDNNNCLIEVYVIDDTDRINKSEMVVNDADSKNKACTDTEVKIPNTCEIIVYDDTSDMKNSICNDHHGTRVSAENLGDFSFGQCAGQEGYYVNVVSQKEYVDQRSLSEGAWSPLADVACVSMSPVTDLRYKNIPYWDSCLLPEIKAIEQRCDKRQIPVIQRQQKRKSQTKMKTGLGLKYEDSADKFMKENSVPKYRGTKVSGEATLQGTFCSSEYEKNAEMKHKFTTNNMAVAKAENENTGSVICSTKFATDGKKSVRVKKEPTKNKMCLSKSVKQSCRRKNKSVMQSCKSKNDELFMRISDGVVERKKMLRKLKNGQYGCRPHVVRVREGGIIVDVTEEYRQYLPYKDNSW